MKFLKFSVVFIAIACVFINCSKEAGDEDSDCENDNTTTITYKNTGSVPLRVQVATQLTPQFVPIDPIVHLDLAPGQTIVKEIPADQYFVVWYSNCAASCSMMTYYSKTYMRCEPYSEERGI
jgi:hypothetical protein